MESDKQTRINDCLKSSAFCLQHLANKQAQLLKSLQELYDVAEQLQLNIKVLTDNFEEMQIIDERVDLFDLPDEIKVMITDYLWADFRRHK
ncbi:hypothetical protein QOT17_005874 [Balamuthia mandrillaris]